MSADGTSHRAALTHDVVLVDRFCVACGVNLRGACARLEPHYGMLLADCPRCGCVAQAQDTPRIARAEQRGQGLALALWLLLLIGAWTATGAAMVGITVVVLEEAAPRLTEFVRQTYRAETSDEGRAFDSSARIVSTAQAPPRSTPPAGVPGSRIERIQAFPVSPGRVIVVTRQDDHLRQRFAEWWAEQDADVHLARAGGFAAAIPWRQLAPLLLMAVAPCAIGMLWPLLLPRVRGWRLVLAWPVIAAWYPAALVVMAIVFRLLHESPSHVATAMIMPIVLPLVGVSLLIALLVGILIGRPVTCGAARLILSPKGHRTLEALWRPDPA